MIFRFHDQNSNSVMNVFYGEIGCKNCQCIRIIIDWSISGSVVFHTLLLMSSTTVIWLKFVSSNWLTCYFNKTRQYASQQQCPNCKTSLVLIFYRIWIHKLQYDHVRSLITNYHNYIKFLYILYIIIGTIIYGWCLPLMLALKVQLVRRIKTLWHHHILVEDICMVNIVSINSQNIKPISI